MTRYIAKPATADGDWWDAKATDYLAKTVHVAEDSPRPTGLLDARGNKLFAVDDKPPVGFVRLGSK